MSASERFGAFGVGRPLGIGPATAMPCFPNPSSVTTAAAIETASNGPGKRGRLICTANRNASVHAAKASVGQWRSPSPRNPDWICVSNLVPCTGMPVVR